MLFYGYWIFLWIKLHRFSHRNATLLYPLYADGYWKISNDPESRSVEVTRGRKVMIGRDTKLVLYQAAILFRMKFNARSAMRYSFSDDIFDAVVFESISKIVIIKRYWKIKTLLWHVPYHNTCIHFDLFESSICLSHFQLVYWHSQFVYLHCSIINLHFPIVALCISPNGYIYKCIQCQKPSKHFPFVNNLSLSIRFLQ